MSIVPGVQTISPKDFKVLGDFRYDQATNRGTLNIRPNLSTVISIVVDTLRSTTATKGIRLDSVGVCYSIAGSNLSSASAILSYTTYADSVPPVTTPVSTTVTGLDIIIDEHSALVTLNAPSFDTTSTCRVYQLDLILTAGSLPSVVTMFAASANVSVDVSSGPGLTYTSDVTVLGDNAANSITTATCIVAVGANALENTTSGNNNTAVGGDSLRSNTISSGSTAVGCESLENSTGGNNTAVGAQSGPTITTGSSNTLLGQAADVDNAAAVNRTVIGNNAVGLTNHGVQLGDAAIGPSTDLRFRSQQVSNTSWIGGGVTTANIDNSGNIVRGVTLPSSNVVGVDDVQTLTNKTIDGLVILDSAKDNTYTFVPSDLTADRNITIPLLLLDDTLVFENHTQTLTNKTISGLSNTIIDLNANNINTGILPVTYGGTGASSLTSGNVLIGDGVNPVNTTKAAPAGDFVGTTDIQTLTNKTINAVLLNVDNIRIDGNIISSTDTNGNISLLPNGTGEVLLKANPVSNLGAVTKQYVDGIATGLTVKDPVQAATVDILDNNTDISGSPSYNNVGGVSSRGQITATLAVSGVFTVDGYVMASTERLLIHNEGEVGGLGGDANGIYEVTIAGTALTLDRATDFDSDAEVTNGSYTLTENGTTNAGVGWILQTPNPITVGGVTGDDLIFAVLLLPAITNASNIGVGGVGLFSSLNSTVLEFKNINTADSTHITVTNDAGNNEVDLDIGTAVVTLNGIQTLTNKTITSSTNTVEASQLRTATTSVIIGGATAPSEGQALIATSGTAATWQDVFGLSKSSVYVATTDKLSNNSSITSITYSSVGGASSNGQFTGTVVVPGQVDIDGITITDADNGARILVKNENTQENSRIETVADVAGSLNSTYFFMYSTTTTYYVWYNVSGGGIDPAPGGTGVVVAIATGASAATVRNSTVTAINSSVTDIIAYSDASITNRFTVVNTATGVAANVADGGAATGFTFTTLNNGSAGDPNGIYTITLAAFPGTSITLDRATDFDSSTDVKDGSHTWVREGTVNHDTIWALITNEPITVGTGGGSELIFEQICNRISGSQDSIAIGVGALAPNSSTSYNNIAIGSLAGFSVTTAKFNTVIGNSSLTACNTGRSNVGVGRNTLRALTSGSNNVAVGDEALKTITTQLDNTAVGYQSQTSSTTGPNTTLGAFSLVAPSSGVRNTSLGYYSMNGCGSGFDNTAVGDHALFNIFSSNRCTAVGVNSQYENGFDDDNTSLGFESLRDNASGTSNVAVGCLSLQTATASSDNTAIGTNAMQASGIVVTNTAVGSATLQFIGDASNNTAIGAQALGNLINTDNNTAVGYRAGYNLLSGDLNVLVGRLAGNALTTGDNNCIMGDSADVDAVTRSNCTILGSTAITIETVDNQFIVGGRTSGRIDVMRIGPDLHVVLPVKTGLTNGGANNLFRTALASAGDSAGFIIRVTVYATDATDYQSRTTEFIANLVNKAGTLTNSSTAGTTNVAASAGTLTVTGAWLTSGTLATYRITPTSSLTTTSVTMRAEIVNLSNVTTLQITAL
jgi:hypothetical protein